MRFIHELEKPRLPVEMRKAPRLDGVRGREEAMRALWPRWSQGCRSAPATVDSIYVRPHARVGIYTYMSACDTKYLLASNFTVRFAPSHRLQYPIAGSLTQ